MSSQSAGRGRTVGTYLGLGLLAAILLFPLYYGIAGSLMTQSQLARYPVAFFPSRFKVSNFADVFKIIPLLRQYGNSAFVTIAVTVGQVVTAVLSAYAFAFLRMPRRGALFALFLVTMMIPGEAIIIPNYLTMAGAGLINTYWALVLPFLAAGFGTFLLRQSFLTFPSELRDAATMDGCGHLAFLWRILLPLSRPALATLSIFVFLSTWNQYFWPLLVTRTPQMQTLQIGISQLQSVDANNENIVLAGVVLALIPTLVLIYAGQRHIVRGLTSGALK
ncbi:MAG: carbohydrate ABC transporter permease [Actinomycetota bacterium]|nr:carbohydrate ABC transporter permease [Actinomycetota bacterium]